MTLSTQPIIIMLIRSNYLGHWEIETFRYECTKGYLLRGNLQFSKNNDFLELNRDWTFGTLFFLFFTLNFLLTFPTNYGLFTSELQSSLAICSGETLCDCWKANPKHKESLPLAAMVPLRRIHQKCEMRIKRLEHMASLPSPACTLVTRRDFSN